jgi:hypothetical protein
MGHHATDATAVEIASFLRSEIGKRGGNDPREHWTVAVQFALNDYKNTKPWPRSQVLPPPNEEDPSKGKKYPFLLDFVVWRRDFAGEKEGARIACESEWNISHASVIEDFHKLMSFKAPYKLMIYDGNGGDEKRTQLHQEFKKALSGFLWHVDDEIYIFLEFVKGNDIARIYTCRPKPAEEIRLLEIKST